MEKTKLNKILPLILCLALVLGTFGIGGMIWENGFQSVNAMEDDAIENEGSENTDGDVSELEESSDQDENTGLEDLDGEEDSSNFVMVMNEDPATALTVSAITVKMNGQTAVWVPVNDFKTVTNELVDASKQLEFQIVFMDADGINPVSRDIVFLENIEIRPGTSGNATAITGVIVAKTNTTGQYKVTIPANTLSPDTSYELFIKKDTPSTTEPIIALPAKVECLFKTAPSSTIPEAIAFRPIFTYPVSGAKDVDINGTFEVAFTDTVTGNAIGSGKAVTLSSGGIIIPATYALSADAKAISITPSSPLAYGTDYRIDVTDKVTHDGTAITPASITFTTTTFKTSSVTATLNEAGTLLSNIAVNVQNQSSSNKKVTVRMEVRRDIGARNTSGGTAVKIISSSQTSITANNSSNIAFSDIDVSKDLYGNAVGGDIYIDIYLLNDKGLAVGSSFNHKISVVK